MWQRGQSLEVTTSGKRRKGKANSEPRTGKIDRRIIKCKE
jgi:hypothetical protein